ncbi:MAG: hypothetical protein EBY26_00195 [Microbacteriaceae bacterium]|nr:hypothetical protein [Microbacteriaceae bacterium]
MSYAEMNPNAVLAAAQKTLVSMQEHAIHAMNDINDMMAVVLSEMANVRDDLRRQLVEKNRQMKALHLYAEGNDNAELIIVLNNLSAGDEVCSVCFSTTETSPCLYCAPEPEDNR